MKLTFAPPKDKRVHTYCIRCQTEGPRERIQADKRTYRCGKCAHVAFRALIIDPAIKWWVKADGEYWHEASGIFVRNNEGKFLFFERNTYPYGLAVPAGHVDKNEPERKTARRELKEETGLARVVRNFLHIATDDIVGDQCRRGADIHRWHSYRCDVPTGVKLVISKREGARPVWLTLREASRRDLTFATRYAMEHNRVKLLAP